MFLIFGSGYVLEMFFFSPLLPPFSLLPSLLFSLLDMLSSHGNFDHPEMNRGVSPQQASPGGTCWLVFRHQANLIGFYGKLAQRWVLAHCRSQPSCSGTWWYCRRRRH